MCPARKATCGKCGREGHYKDYCKSVQPVNEVDESNDDTEDVNALSYSVNVFRVKASMKGNDCDFKTELMVNGKLDTVLADTGAKVSVCGLKKAMEWNLLDKMIKSDIKIKPYKSNPIPTVGASRCAVSFGSSSVPVEWQIIKDDCEPVLAGIHAKQLGIIKFCSNPSTYKPINMIRS